jgi:spheroidene monooxygenase
MMGAARLPMSRLPDVQFWKICGSGGGEGFTPRVNVDVFAILCVWPDRDFAEKHLANARIFQRYRDRADEEWTLYLAPVSARGAWSGVEPFSPDSEPVSGPLAALTRATLKPAKMARFWKHAPGISDVIGADPNVAFKIGIGEVPLLQQVTFSIWPDTKTMADFARSADGPHAKAIKATRDGGWFREELYARFRILGDSGTWNGDSPLKRLTTE